MTVALVRIASVDDVVRGTGKVIEAGGTTLALFNLDGKFYATNNKLHTCGRPAR